VSIGAKENLPYHFGVEHLSPWKTLPTEIKKSPSIDFLSNLNFQTWINSNDNEEDIFILSLGMPAAFSKQLCAGKINFGPTGRNRHYRPKGHDADEGWGEVGY
jgi:hypothetical protein